MQQDLGRKFWVLLRVEVKVLLGQTGSTGNEVLLLPSEK